MLFRSDHQGVKGDNYRVFYVQSAPDYVMPSGNWLGSQYAGGPNHTGLSNQEMWDRHKNAIAGAVAPCTTTRPEVVGFMCRSTQPPPQAVSLPSAPRNVRLVSN